MKTTEIAVVELLDEFDFEQDYVRIPATFEALCARERVVLVQDDSCEYVVTLEKGRALKLWAIGDHFLDHDPRPFKGTMAEAVTQATAWLAAYLEKPETAIDAILDVDDFPAGPLPGSGGVDPG